MVVIKMMKTNDRLLSWKSYSILSAKSETKFTPRKSTTVRVTKMPRQSRPMRFLLSFRLGYFFRSCIKMDRFMIQSVMENNSVTVKVITASTIVS